MAVYSEPGELGTAAPDFALAGVDGKIHKLSDYQDAKALVIVFMCNHCPYVQAVQKRINELVKEFKPRGVELVGISSNDTTQFPEDNIEAMKERAEHESFAFPYLWDESQGVAKAYGAVCTPDFYVYAPQDQTLTLKYRGRLDDHWKDEKAVTRRDLANALNEILAGRDPHTDQKPSMGCSIKWKHSEAV